MDVARATEGHGWPIVAGLWNGDGVSEPSRSEGRMNGRKGLVTLPAKVTRPGGRNQKHQQKRGNSEQASETPYCQSGITTTSPPSPQ